MLDMGFKPQVERIVRRLPSERQTMLFSATLDGEVGVLAPRVHAQPDAASRPSARRGRRRGESSTASSRSPPTTRSTA